MNTKLTLKNDLGKILQSSPAERARSIIESPHTREILEKLSPQETYLILKEAWGSDTQILMQYVTPETITRCIDMDCWDKDSISLEGLLDWLWEIYSSSIDTLQEALQTIDLDLIILLYQSYLDVVQVVPTDEGIDDILDQGYETFDDIYYFLFRVEDEKVQLLRDMLSLLFANHQNTYYSIMEGVIWELRSSVEETVYERRSFRLMEMGFPPPDEAMSIYRRAQPKKLLNAGISKAKVPIVDEEQEFLPALYMEHLSENTGLIVETLREAPAETRERFIFEMIYLANKIIMADYRPLNETDGMKDSIGKASSLTSLGLAVAMKAQSRTAREVLEAMNAEILFSLGYNSVQDQKSRLKQLLQHTPLAMIPENLTGFVEGLMKKRPLYKTEEFSSIEQLDEVTRDIDRIEAMAVLMGSLGWEKARDIALDTNTGQSPDMEAVILTSLALNSLAGESSFEPLDRRQLTDFVGKATVVDSSGRRLLNHTFRDNLILFLGSLGTQLSEDLIRDAADILMKRFEEELSGIADLEEIDPRFIACFVVKT